MNNNKIQLEKMLITIYDPDDRQRRKVSTHSDQYHVKLL